jgi:hypothetical protein
MNRIQIALASLLVLCFTLGYGQQQGSQPQPDAASQQEPQRPPNAVSPERTPESSPSQENPQQEPPPKSEKKEAPGSPKEQPKAGQEENQHPQKDQTKGKGVHIPEAKFKASFGHSHTFTVKRIITQTTVVPRQTQFIFAGYTFVFLDPWPTAWLLTDDCYIDYVDDEYFLFDVSHPGIRVALLVVE